MLNLCQFIGNLGADPESRATQGGQNVTKFRIACSEKWKDRDGNAQERTEWVTVVAWGKLADVCAQYLARGKQVYVQGRMQTRKWQDKDGNDRYSTEIVASEVKFLGGKSDGADGERRGAGTHTRTDADTRRPASRRDDSPPPGDEDIPF